MLWPKKYSYKEFDNEKKFLRLENSPPPITFLMVRPLSYIFWGGGGRAGRLWGGMAGHFIFRRIEGGIIRICEPKKDIINEEELELRIQKDDSNLLDNASLRAYKFFPCFLVQWRHHSSGKTP